MTKNIVRLPAFAGALAFAAFALPAFAVDKYFSLQTTTLTIPSAVTQSYTATWSNSPTNSGGNSVLNSVKLDIPAGVGFTISQWQTQVGCSAAGATGTNVGTAYVPQLYGTTPLAPNQTISPQTVPVQIAINGFTGAKPGDCFVLTLAVSIPSKLASCTLSKGYAWTGNTWGGTQFKPSPSGADVETSFVCTLGCNSLGTFGGGGDASAGTVDPNADNAFGLGDNGKWGLVRYVNDPPSTCQPIQFTFTLNSDNTASFNVIDKKGQSIIVEYVAVWPNLVPVDQAPATYTAGAGLNAGWTPVKRPYFSWGVVANSPPVFPGDFVPALACINDLPVAASLPFIPDVDPFHNNVYSQYQPLSGGNPQQAAACVAQQGFTSVGNSQLLYWSKVINRDLITKFN